MNSKIKLMVMSIDLSATADIATSLLSGIILRRDVTFLLLPPLPLLRGRYRALPYAQAQEEGQANTQNRNSNLRPEEAPCDAEDDQRAGGSHHERHDADRTTSHVFDGVFQCVAHARDIVEVVAKYVSKGIDGVQDHVHSYA